jgi:Tol biopolymer transport system component
MAAKTKVFTLLLYALFLIMNQNAFSQDIEPLSKIGIFDQHTIPGYISDGTFFHYDAKNSTYTVSTSASEIHQEGIAPPFLWKAIQGDFILRAEIMFDNDQQNGPKAGWMLRNSISVEQDENDIFVSVGPVGLDSAQSTSQDTDKDAIYVLQLSRVGDQLTFKMGHFGEHLETVRQLDNPLKNELFAGLSVMNSAGTDAEVTFRNVRIVKPAPESMESYQSYLGSRLEIVDIEDGNRTVLYETEHSIQAPNWTVDGKKLIVNSNGYLYNYHLKSGTLSRLNTGFATNNNNDHVISFDGSMLAISHHNEEYGGESTIYTLPIEGSDNPKQVTRSGLGASYLHGISPDNQTVIFTGNRNGQYDIYAADTETMEETQLTDTPGLDDGSEYSPDGKYIYFNSNRTGTMQIWRMDADGSNKKQLTFDKNTHDWFPHISPDGKWIVFLSYGLDVASGDHPFYKEVTLQLMPAEGGEPRVVAYLYGGQGTINVPSWSPDSKKVSFVSNSGRFY